ncbi:MAG TPA: hypothetical protein VFR31_21085, partial [Thermoanaerobaculia bacterium]|nr:hypothetical protein [Thermoanaerobaculia bacterium]
MTEGHPTRAVLERFVIGSLPLAEMKQVSQHLIDGCLECQKISASLWERGAGEVAASPRRLQQKTPSEPDEAIDRIFRVILAREAEVARERMQGRELFDELMRHPPARQQMMVANSVRFRTRMLCEVLLEQAHEAGFREPGRAIELARLAVEIADRLQKGDGVEGLRARAWAQYGNALRITSDLAGADQAFEIAVALLDSKQVAPHETARVLDLEASLRRDQRRFADANRLMDKVIAIYRKLGQCHLLGRSLQQKAMVCGE